MFSVIIYLILAAACYWNNFPNTENKFSVIIVLGFIFLIYHISHCSRWLAKIYDKMPVYEDDGDEDTPAEKLPENENEVEEKENNQAPDFQTGWKDKNEIENKAA